MQVTICRSNIREARDTRNLQPVERVFRVNWEFYAYVFKARVCLGPAKMQQMRFNQLINHKAKTTVA